MTSQGKGDKAALAPVARPAKDIAAGVPIVGFTGVNGAGKTLLAVQSAICDLQRGRAVYSTVPISSPWGDSRPIRSLRQLLELEDSTILFDEVSVIFSSRSTGSLPPDIVAMLQTVRHRRNTVRWTAPAWMRCDNLLREVTQGLVSVSPLFTRHIGGSPWPTPSLVMAGLLDTTTGKVDEMPTRVLRRRFYVPRRLLSWGAYDTHSDTPMLGRELQAGTCLDCGGSIKREACSPDRHQQLGIAPPIAPTPRPHTPLDLLADLRSIGRQHETPGQ